MERRHVTFPTTHISDSLLLRHTCCCPYKPTWPTTHLSDNPYIRQNPYVRQPTFPTGNNKSICPTTYYSANTLYQYLYDKTFIGNPIVRHFKVTQYIWKNALMKITKTGFGNLQILLITFFNFIISNKTQISDWKSFVRDKYSPLIVFSLALHAFKMSWWLFLRWIQNYNNIFPLGLKII